MIARVLLAFFRYGFAEASSYRFTFVARIMTAFASIAGFSYLARFVNSGQPATLDVYGGDYFGFVLLGVLTLQLQFRVISAYPQAIRSAQLRGTLEAIFATPVPGWLVLVASPIFEIVVAMVWFWISLGIGVIFGMDVSRANWPAAIAVFFLLISALISMGFLAASMTMYLRRNDPLSVLLSAISGLVSGPFYPVTVLPAWLGWIGFVLPMTHGLELLRKMILTGAGFDGEYRSLMALSAITVVLMPLGVTLFGWGIRRARIDGSLSHY